MAFEQDLQRCISCMDKIKKGLDNFGFSTIMTNDKTNILCKVSGYGNNDANTVSVKNTAVATTCPHSASATKCPYTACMYPNSSCHLHSTNNGTDGSTDSSENSGILVEGYAGSLFRIMVNDLKSGLFLHVIKLHGETSDLKMSFGYSNQDVIEIINVIKFLVD